MADFNGDLFSRATDEDPFDYSDDEIEEEEYNTRAASIFLIEMTPTLLAPTLPPPAGPATLSTHAYKPVLPPLEDPNAVGAFGAPKSKLEAILRFLYELLRRKVGVEGRDLVGVYFASCLYAPTQNSTVKGVMTVLPLELTTAKRILQLQALLELAERDHESFVEKYTPYPMLSRPAAGMPAMCSTPAASVRASSSQYARAARRPTDEGGERKLVEAWGFVKGLLQRMKQPGKGGGNSDKAIYFISDNDYGIDGRFLQPAESQLSDMRGCAIEFVALLIPAVDGTAFNLDLLYGPLLYSDISDTFASSNLTASLPEALEGLRDTLQNYDVKRSFATLGLELGGGVTLGIKMYNMLGIKTKKNAAKADLRGEGTMVTSRTTWFDIDTSRPLDPKKQIMKYIQIGKTAKPAAPKAANKMEYDPDGLKALARAEWEANKPKMGMPVQVFLDESEMETLKRCGVHIGIKIIGFKPLKDLLLVGETIKHPYFLQPDETNFHGSRRAFDAMIDGMIKNEVGALGTFLPRKTSSPRICLLLAQQEVLNSTSGHQTVPPGMHLIQLPFADDKRPIPFEGTGGLPKEVKPEMEKEEEDPQVLRPKQLMGNVISKMTEMRLVDPEDEAEIAAGKWKKVPMEYVPSKYPNPALNFHYDTIAALALNEPIPTHYVDSTQPNYARQKANTGRYITELQSLVPMKEIDTSRVKTSNKKAPKRPKEIAPLCLEDLYNFACLFEEKQDKITIAQLKEGASLMEPMKRSGLKAELMTRVWDGLQELGYLSRRGRAQYSKVKEDADEAKPSKSKAAKIDHQVEEEKFKAEGNDSDIEFL